MPLIDLTGLSKHNSKQLLSQHPSSILLSNKSSLLLDVSQTTVPDNDYKQGDYSPNDPIVIVNMDDSVNNNPHNRRGDMLPIYRAA